MASLSGVVNGTRRMYATAGLPRQLADVLERVCSKLPEDPPSGFRIRSDLHDFAERRRKRFTEAIGARYQHCRLDNFVASRPEQKAVLDAVCRYADNLRENIAEGRNLILFGPVGTGKDHLLCALGQLAVSRSTCVEYVTGAALYANMRKAMMADEEHALLDRYGGADVLILSDPAPPRDRLTDYQADTLYWIVDERYRSRRPTWVSLNVATADEADARLGSPIVDRLQDGAVILRCDWPSYRKPFGGGDDQASE